MSWVLLLFREGSGVRELTFGKTAPCYLEWSMAYLGSGVQREERVSVWVPAWWPRVNLLTPRLLVCSAGISYPLCLKVLGLVIADAWTVLGAR